MDDGRWQTRLAEEARAVLPAPVFRYLTAGAGQEVTRDEAEAAWRAIRFAPRVLTDVREVSTRTRMLGREYESPVAIAPTSMLRLADPDGELAMAEAARHHGSPLVVSTNAGTSFEQIGRTGVDWWLQVYLPQRRETLRPVLRRAVDAGARALVLTLDTPVVAAKHGVDIDLLPDVAGAYRTNHDVGAASLGEGNHRSLGADDISWLASISGLPVVVKGVLRADDACRAVAAGAAAVWVSNHGGRQLDRSIATATALPLVRSGLDEAGHAAVEVYVDGGVRGGTDVLAAVTMGASGVFLGRLPLLALAAGGERQVSRTLARIDAELLEALTLAGCPDLASTRGITVNQA